LCIYVGVLKKARKKGPKSCEKPRGQQPRIHKARTKQLNQCQSEEPAWNIPGDNTVNQEAAQ
jgi:hypothetical protein